MYAPSHFEESRVDVLHELIRTQPLGLLVTQGASGLAANSIPFLVDAGPGPFGTLRAHVARANPVWRDAPETDTLVVFQGPQAYVSPNWYPSKAATGKAVPTWNYVMVQARGRLRIVDDVDWLRTLVTRLTAVHEHGQPKPWTIDEAPPDFMATMLRAIVGIEIELTALTGKWKVSQNRPAADRDGVVHGLAAQGHAQALQMAELVQGRGGAG